MIILKGEEIMKKLFAVALFLLLCVSQASAASDVKVWGARFDLNIIDNFYDNLVGHNSDVISDITLPNALAGTKLLWSVQPANTYTASELTAMSAFLSGGGRIAFMGEHGFYAPAEDNRITAAIASLGGHISINLDAPDGGFHDATRVNGQILTHSLTTGVDTYNYACFASLNISGAAQALMVGTDHSQIMMAYENVGAGSIFLITDQNVWDNVSQVGSNDNHRMFENLLEGNTNNNNAVPEPATVVLLGLGLGLVGFTVKRKRM